MTEIANTEQSSSLDNLSVEELYALTDSMAFSAQHIREIWPNVDIDALHAKLTRRRGDLVSGRRS